MQTTVKIKYVVVSEVNLMNKIAAILVLLFSNTCFGHPEPFANLQQNCVAGDLEVCIDLGNKYFDGDGVQRDYTKAVNYLSLIHI